MQPKGIILSLSLSFRILRLLVLPAILFSRPSLRSTLAPCGTDVERRLGQENKMADKTRSHKIRKNNDDDKERITLWLHDMTEQN